jgi:hypothetical protein
MHTSTIAVFYILTEVIGLRFGRWRWVPQLLSDNQKVDRGRQALVLLAALTAAERRRWLDFWTDDEP